MQEVLPRAETIRAAIRLLADHDRSVFDACRRQLIAWSFRARPELRRASGEHPDPRVRAAVRGVLRTIEVERWTRHFVAMVASWRRDPARVDLLDEGLRRLAELLGGVDSAPDHLRTSLDDLAARLRPLVAGRTSTTAARNLGAFLSTEVGFRGEGNVSPRRAHVRPDRAIRTGRATSALLTALTLVLGRRAELELTGVRLPEFHLVRVHGRRRVLVDPYHDSRTVTRSDCLRYLRARTTGVSPSQYLDDVDDAAVLLGVFEDAIRAHDRDHEAELRSALRRVSAALGRSARRQLS